MPGDQAGEDAQRLARAIHRAGMSGTARVALEVLKPLHWIAGQFAWAVEPFLGGFGPLSGRSATSTGNIARLLEREDGVSQLSAHLDELLREEQGHSKAAVKENQT